MFVSLEQVFTSENILYLGKGALMSLGIAILFSSNGLRKRKS